MFIKKLLLLIAFQMCFCEIYTTAAEPKAYNLAILKPVMATSEKENVVFDERNLNDGNLMTRWEAKELPADITIDLEGVYEFSEISIYNQGGIERYAIFTSNDKINWAMLINEEKGGRIPKREEFTRPLSVDGKGRYIKLTIVEPAVPERFAIFEIEVYGNLIALIPKDELEEIEAEPKADDNGTEYTDIDNHWAKDAIMEMSKRGNICGDGQEHFNPDGQITRAEFSKLICLMLGLDVSGSESDFIDVTQELWHYHYISALFERGIVNGADGRYFEPDAPITREDAAVILFRALEFTEVPLDVQKFDFADKNQISDYAKEAVFAVADNGLILGRDSDSFVPKDFLTRAEAVMIVYRVIMGR